MAILTNPKPTIYFNLYENTGPGGGLILACNLTVHVVHKLTLLSCFCFCVEKCEKRNGTISFFFVELPSARR